MNIDDSKEVWSSRRSRACRCRAPRHARMWLRLALLVWVSVPQLRRDSSATHPFWRHPKEPFCKKKCVGRCSICNLLIFATNFSIQRLRAVQSSPITPHACATFQHSFVVEAPVFVLHWTDNARSEVGRKLPTSREIVFRVPCRVVRSCGREMCLGCRVRSGSVSSLLLLLLLLLLPRRCPVHVFFMFCSFFSFFIFHFSCVCFFMFFVFSFFMFSIFPLPMRFRVAALASNFIIPTSVSAVWLVS